MHAFENLISKLKIENLIQITSDFGELLDAAMLITSINTVNLNSCYTRLNMKNCLTKMKYHGPYFTQVILNIGGF